MDLELPDVDRFTARLAELHRNSTSPNGKVGYHLTTYNGILPQDNRWTDSWEEYFSNNFRRMIELEQEAQGPPTEEQISLTSSMLEMVIPRLLRPLETEGRKVKPCLIQYKEPIVFDASAFYGHNEYEVRTMRPDVRFKFGRAYLKAYHRNYPIALPLEDHADRNSLYSIRSRLHDSCLFRANPRFRQILIDEMRKLVERFPNGYEAPCRPGINLEETPRESTFSNTHLNKVPECVM
ncbi:hypothetical protein G7Y79_00014g036120 [Physcia stellaris]|nr:hypothetical protein G7Y79_00014g036120 [Physcia stellaris]